MRISRRSWLFGCAGIASAARTAAAGFESGKGTGALGLVIHSFMVHTAGDRGRAGPDRFRAPERFLEVARTMDAAGVQVGFGVLEDSAADALRERARAASMYLEGIVSLPRDQADLVRFEAEIRTAKRAGVQVVRTVMLSGRRYETFATLAAFRRFAESSSRSLKLASGVVAREGVRLAVENHKDWRADELLRVLKEAGNDHVGVCLDTGNSMALLEDPMEVVEALAPRAFTTHFKDMARRGIQRGLPAGGSSAGHRRARPASRDSHTSQRSPRDPPEPGDDHTRPAQGPVSGRKYWATFADLPASTSPACWRLSATVRRHALCQSSVNYLVKSSFGRRMRTIAVAWRSHTIAWPSEESSLAVDAFTRTGAGA